jgi:ketosteroid isomerase-like protein
MGLKMRERNLLSQPKSYPARVLALAVAAVLGAPCGHLSAARAAEAAGGGASAIESELRHTTQLLLDAIAPGDVAVWDKWLDPAVLQVDENDIVRGKSEILAELKPLGPGLVGHLYIDDFRVAVSDNVVVVTHEDNETLDYHGQMLLSRFRMTDTWRKTRGGWRLLGQQVLAVLQDPPSVTLDHPTLCSYAGRYALTDTIVATVRCTDDRLVVAREGQPERTFLAEVKDVFFEPGHPRTRRIFLRDAGGRITGFVERREARDVRWVRQPESAS